MNEEKAIWQWYSLIESETQVVNLSRLMQFCAARSHIDSEEVCVWLAKEKLKGTIKTTLVGADCYLLRKSLTLK